MTDDRLRPFELNVDQSELDDLRRRLLETRWPRQLPGAEWSRGIPVDELRQLTQRWLHEFDWRAVERRLNSFEQAVTEIDGVSIHLLHVRSPRPDAVPLVMTHGWPGSVLEFLEIVDLLARPDDAREPAFHLVLPSLPGFGLSGQPADPGWDPRRIADAWATLMDRLGYDRYGAQGGDWGAVVSQELGRRHPDAVIGVHLNLIPGAQATEAPSDADLAGLDDTERDRWAASWTRMREWLAEEEGYSLQQATKPQTIGYALTDSPVGQLAWIAEKLHTWTDPRSTVDPDWLLANTTLYWLTRSAGSSAAIYYEREHADNWGSPPAPSSVPTGYAEFPHELFLPVRTIAERHNQIVHWQTKPRGGHFAALEEPELLAGDIRQFFSSLPSAS